MSNLKQKDLENRRSKIKELSKEREAKGISKSEMARLAGVTRRTIIYAEKGEYVSWNVIDRYISVLSAK